MSGSGQASSAETHPEVAHLRGLRAQDIKEIIACARHRLPALHVAEAHEIQLRRLMGTTTLEGLHIIDALQSTAGVAGDVCEFGVAQGRTSALIAITLREMGSDRVLWLYDSFEGLPAPTTKDVMLHDLFGLGSMENYRGILSVPEMEVRAELAAIGVPPERFTIRKGWIENEIHAGHVPDRISVAYLDMDFYRSTKDVLTLLVDRMPSGGKAVIDDYGFFSEGVRTAVTEIMTEHPAAFDLDHPFGFKFVVLTRR